MQQRAAGLILLIDTCGERGSVALCDGAKVLAEVSLPERMASGAALGAIREALEEAGVGLAELAGVGVVNGPGSFTGVRVGVAIAKGLCESQSLRLAAVSRLLVLACASGLRDGFAVLRAGNDQVYVTELVEAVPGKERLMQTGAFLELAGDREVVSTDVVLSRPEKPLRERRVALSARDALGPVMDVLARGGSDLALVDANYVRDEEAIYVRRQAQR